MGKNCELTVAMRTQIIGLCKGGHTMQNISKLLNLPIGTVKTTIRCYGNSEMPISKRRSGRPKLFGDREQKVLKEIIDENNKVCLEELRNVLLIMVGQPRY